MPVLLTVETSRSLQCPVLLARSKIYANAHGYLFDLGKYMAAQIFTATKVGTLDFVGGSFVLAVCAMVFTPIYLLAANFWGVIETEEKDAVKNFVRKFMPRRGSSRVVETIA